MSSRHYFSPLPILPLTHSSFPSSSSPTFLNALLSSNILVYLRNTLMDSHTLNGKRPRKFSPITQAQIDSEFSHHHPTISRINNGSFGSCPQSIIAAQRSWQNQFLSQPDGFYFSKLKPGIANSRSIVRALVNAAHVDEVSLVDNATTAAAIVLQNTAWGFLEGKYAKGDVAIMLHYAYGAVKKSVEAYVTRAGGCVVEVPLRFPVKSEEEIICQFKETLEMAKTGGRKVRLAVIDHVTSMPSVVIPVKELVAICRKDGVDKVFVDAAHGIGCVDVDMQEIGADYYTSNLHKWFFCPPSVAFLYCRRKSLSLSSNVVGDENELHHPVVSQEYGKGLAAESAWIGNRDYSAQLVVPASVEFVNRFPGGIDGIKKRNHDAVVEMGEMLVKAWGTHLGSPPQMCGSMIMVGLPPCLRISNENDGLKLRTHLRDCFGVEVPIYVRPLNKDEEVGSVVIGYARISHQVYNKVEDYYKFRDAINKLVSDGFTCSSLTSNQTN